jgi:hypothetical protein
MFFLQQFVIWMTHYFRAFFLVLFYFTPQLGTPIVMKIALKNSMIRVGVQ